MQKEESKEWRKMRNMKLCYRKTEEPENHEAFFYVRFLLICVNNCIQMHLTLLNLIKPNLT